MEFDYIVVGSGSAGCPLAARLVERKQSVLLLEAGKKERLNLSHVPGALVYTIGNRRYDWAYKTEPDPSRGGVVEDWPRGKVPGGSSAINGMIFIRGAARDYDAWEALGNRGWGWKDVLPYFRKMETADEDRDNQFRGGLGPQRASALRWRHPISQKFIDSVQAAGIPFNEEISCRESEQAAREARPPGRGSERAACVDSAKEPVGIRYQSVSCSHYGFALCLRRDVPHGKTF
ncbi:GMC family oxidoreductase N-terminal domain-containing protein [Bradyrhizobium yuanmingense]|uniref:GMC family oxidoreductase n=1 Tax=Bradyrhizobium yuanmingense TaxID=108015 RepID=UPI001CD1D05B|nr:GMC family oxidoreductase N-terminal domain-containing protein [Bradyrhizobium yuanmingense]